MPRKPAIEKQLGQQLAAAVCNHGVSWDIIQQRGAIRWARPPVKRPLSIGNA
ncbi:hypothetical protein [Paraburkholderia xenovorans]|uniref:hypothetical protein n=1 Tax=Paraburkholderia xenovorans TaxID=36873 RepID=UPI00389946DF